ncbi:hypothetical protein BH10BAC2_BH10BAC2_27230 [soil metagenome]
MLTKPYLAKCADRNSMPKSHPTSGSPEEWLSNSMLSQINLTGISFDFFVDWNANPNAITPVIWIKRILLSQFSYQQLIQNLDEIIILEFGINYLNLLDAFARNNQFTVQFVIFRDDLDWAQNTSEILFVNLVNANANIISFTTNLISIDIVKNLIRQHSGGPIQIGAKGLIYGTSNLECHLSHTDSLYPGDVDLIILNNESKPLCILEFKKHTLNNSISLQRLSNYYPNPDGRKYNRLAILKDYLNETGLNVPIFIVYYPTNPAFTEGRLELLQGNIGNLSTKVASNFDLPVDNSNEEYIKIINKLVKAIEYHNSLV